MSNENKLRILPTDPKELSDRYRTALLEIKKIIEHPEDYPELVRANKLNVYIHQIIEDAILGNHILMPG